MRTGPSFTLVTVFVCIAYVLAGCQPDEPAMKDRPVSHFSDIEPVDSVHDLASYQPHVGPFFEHHAPPSQDALELLQIATSTAAKEQKNVLIQMSGPGCAPCAALTRAFSNCEHLISKDYIYLQLDRRMPNCNEVWTAYADGLLSVPWVSIISPSGSLLASSELDGENVGCPGGDAGKQHYWEMLTATSRQLSRAEIDAIIREFGPWSSPVSTSVDEPSDPTQQQ